MINPIPQYKGINATVQITEDCNLRCRYCYQTDKKPKTIRLGTAKKFIDLILEDSDPVGIKNTRDEWIINNGLIIDLLGGDALMYPELCDSILEYTQYRLYELNHKWKNRWRCSISTNGTLFDNTGVKEFLLKYKDNISLGVSVDGCPKIHNLNRSNSMGLILKNWDWYLQYAGNAASTKATLNKESIPYLYESVKFLHEDLNLKHIHMNFIFEDMELEKNDLLLIEKEFNKIVDYIYDHRDDIYFSMFSKEFGIGRASTQEEWEDNWCGAGYMPALAVSGKIYPCFRFLPNSVNSKKDFYVGDVEKGFTHKYRFKEIQKQTRKKISPKKCKECNIENSCAWCIAGSFSEKGKFYRQTYLCEVKKLIHTYSTKYWNMLGDNYEVL